MCVTGQIFNFSHVRYSRALLMGSFGLQSLLVLLVAILVHVDALQLEQKADALGIICLLSISVGSQQVSVKAFETPEINSTMVTIPICDVLSDPHIFARPRDNDLRNRRVGFFLAFFVEAIVGGCILHWNKPQLAIVLAGAIKAVVAIAIAPMPARKEESGGIDGGHEK